MKVKLILLIVICSISYTNAQIYTPNGLIQGKSGNNNIGIGISYPEAKLDVVGNGRFSTGILSSETNTFEKVFPNAAVFENGITNSAVDIRLGNLSFGGILKLK